MVFIALFIGALALFSGLVSARPAPKPDSAIGDEVAVSAPNGVILSDTAALATQLGVQTQVQTETQTAAQTLITSSSFDTASMAGSGLSSSDSSSLVAASASQTFSMPAYGSGSSNGGSSGYNDCVNQCIAKFGAPSMANSPPTATSSSGGSAGSGVTHTVIVAPTQGVLRYIPFAVNASVGDTVKFMWGANNHTVTKSSALTLCNKTHDAPFTSGVQLKDFVFTQVVNDTAPTFFYCGVPNHCQKGMFGIINPVVSLGAPSSVSGQMSSLSTNSSDMSAFAAYTDKVTANNVRAARWGGNIDLASLPDWSHSVVAENVLYTRTFLANNAEVLKQDGSVDLSATGTTPLMIPQDLSAALNAAAASSTSASQSASTAASSQASAAHNGVSSSASPRVLVGVIVAVATFFAL